MSLSPHETDQEEPSWDKEPPVADGTTFTARTEVPTLGMDVFPPEECAETAALAGEARAPLVTLGVVCVCAGSWNG